MFKRLVIALALVSAIFLPGLIAAREASAHTGYETVYVSPGGTTYFKDFYVSAGARHGIQQVYPGNVRCYHRIIHRATGQQIVGIWLYGSDYNYSQSYFTFGHNSSTSQAFRHSVSGCSGRVDIYNYH